MTEEQLDRLPKFAQEAIRKITGEREAAIRALNEYCDAQTPSPFSIEELESTGEEGGPSQKVRYIQSHKMKVEWGGVELEIYLRDDEIQLSWQGNTVLDDVAFIPASYQSAKLKAWENMRARANQGAKQ